MRTRWTARRCLHFLQEKPVTQTDDMASPKIIHEVSATVDAALTREDLEGLNEAERLALVVGAAYGKALADRDAARALAEDAVGVLEALVAEFPDTSFAHANVAVDKARAFIQAYRTPEPVDSEQTPAQED
jgi:hypothetical protein